MYNLFISGDEEAWLNNSYILDRDRCIKVKEFTSEEIVEKYGSLTVNQISEIKKFPCIFAYETQCKKDPKFGYLTDITERQNKVRLEINFIETPSFITHDGFLNYDFDLDISNWEYNRTHWAIKDVDLYKFFEKNNIKMPLDIEYIDEDAFLEKEIATISFDNLNIPSDMKLILESRFKEIKRCLRVSAPLSAIFLCGSILEGLLLNLAKENPKRFNTSNSAPKNIDNKVKQFQEWSLNNLINVAHENGILRDDVKVFSHALRDFRNYIHPYLQLSSGFNPDMHTARICFQVLKAAISQLNSFNETK